MSIEQKISLITITNNLEDCKKYVFKNYNDFYENILVITDENNKITFEGDNKTKIYYYKWKDNYSAALNFAISKCHGDWILRLDSDEYILPLNVHACKQHIQEEHYDCFITLIYTYLESPDIIQKPKIRHEWLPRLWRANKGVRFEFLVHEQNIHSIQRKGLRIGWYPDLIIQHFGELYNAIRFDHKKEYYKKLTLLQLKKTPEERRFYEHMFNYHYAEGNFKQALFYLDQTIKYCPPELLFNYINIRKVLIARIKEPEQIESKKIVHLPAENRILH